MWLFLKIIFIFYWKGGYTERRDREEDLPTNDSRGGAVVKVLALHARDPIWAPVLIPAAPLPFQLPACGLGKQLRTAQGFGTLHPRGRPGRGSWLRTGIAWVVVLTWGVNHRTEDLPLCLSSLYIRQWKNNNNKSLFKKKSHLLLSVWTFVRIFYVNKNVNLLVFCKKCHINNQFQEY